MFQEAWQTPVSSVTICIMVVLTLSFGACPSVCCGIKKTSKYGKWHCYHPLCPWEQVSQGRGEEIQMCWLWKPQSPEVEWSVFIFPYISPRSPKCEEALSTEKASKQWQRAFWTAVSECHLTQQTQRSLENGWFQIWDRKGLSRPGTSHYSWEQGSCQWEGLIWILIWKETNFNTHELIHERTNKYFKKMKDWRKFEHGLGVWQI